MAEMKINIKSANAGRQRIKALLSRLSILIAERDNRRRFAQAIDALPQQISGWLEGRYCPSAENTLAIQEWVNSQENKKTSPKV
jgi:hypothetical protein